MLDYARRRGAFPDSARRWCTSEFKRGPILKHFTAMALRWQREHETRRPCRILDCIGLRGEESAARAKRAVFTPRLSTRNKHVDTFLPIHALTEDDVWARIHASGAPVHPAYALGMSRLSCVFCILAGKKDLEIAARHNPELLAEYIEVERETGHDFKQGFSLASLE